MQKSGWTPGTALGASSVPIPVSQSTASQVKIRIKDDTLGLGANLKSRDIEAQRTGLDAFQGLLGRLNAKDGQELKAVEEKIENKKLAMFAMGRWGGMVFVPGGVLVQEDPTKKKKAEVQSANVSASEDEEQKEEDQSDVSGNDDNDSATAQKKTSSKSRLKSKVSKKFKHPDETPEQRTQRKAEKRARKEARLLKKLQKEARRTGTGTGTSTPASSTSEPTTQPSTTTNTGTSTPVSTGDINITSISRATLKNGRHLLRGRNIQAKKMAFSDARGLDQIFMRRVEGRTEA